MLVHVAPFAQRALRVDLDACDRALRLVVFRPAEPEAGSELRAHYELLLHGEGATSLMRIATLGDRLQATATAQGDDIEALLETLETLPLARHFTTVDGVSVAYSYDIEPEAGAQPALTGCAAVVGDLLIETDARTVVGEPMTTTLRVPDPERRYRLPDDLLLLTHRAWRPLTDTDMGWSSNLRVPVREPARSRATMRRFADMVSGVDGFLRRPPADYHRLHRGARWRVYARRLVPALTCVLIVASLPLLDIYVLDSDRAMHPAFLSLPPLLMVAAMLMTWRDMPRIEIPPWPKPLADDAWPCEGKDATDNAGDAQAAPVSRSSHG